jgi:sugar phosphate permease
MDPLLPPQVGQRVRIVVAYLFITLGVLAALRGTPAGAPQVTWLVIAALGFGIYGPQASGASGCCVCIGTGLLRHCLGAVAT